MSELIPSPTAELVKASEVPTLLEAIRPAWQAKDLINRVRRLIPVDPSSACQRLFNASVHDLREKVVVAGLDIATEAAKQYKLPPVGTAEDIENYSTSKLIDLAYRMGILSRPDWRRLSRCYEIRRDLEHEDDEYEAGVEDCVYIFQTCINVVLSNDPIHLIRVTDVKELVEQPDPSTPAPSLLEDYEHAPKPRQVEILKFLASVALDSKQSDLVRQNAFNFLGHFSELTQNSSRLELASHLQGKITRGGSIHPIIRVAYASGTLPYLKQAHLKDFYAGILEQMKKVGYRWGAHSSHGELLRTFKEVGGLSHCPKSVRKEILQWLMLAYLGERGGRTSYGNIRNVYYSNTAAPLVEELISSAATVVRDEVRDLAESKAIKRAVQSDHIQRRLDSILDWIEEGTEES
ncbi:hypothetical protein EGM51_09850 [Verrucomicrobia bacterium S94]|nr:hypothetical protein EGM51_09850 [Verrucomicrobia bacterium S94]